MCIDQWPVCVLLLTSYLRLLILYDSTEACTVEWYRGNNTTHENGQHTVCKIIWIREPDWVSLNDRIIRIELPSRLRNYSFTQAKNSSYGSFLCYSNCFDNHKHVNTNIDFTKWRVFLWRYERGRWYFAENWTVSKSNHQPRWAFNCIPEGTAGMFCTLQREQAFSTHYYSQCFIIVVYRKS